MRRGPPLRPPPAPALLRRRRPLRAGGHLRHVGAGALRALHAHAAPRRRTGRRRWRCRWPCRRGPRCSSSLPWSWRSSCLDGSRSWRVLFAWRTLLALSRSWGPCWFPASSSSARPCTMGRRPPPVPLQRGVTTRPGALPARGHARGLLGARLAVGLAWSPWRMPGFSLWVTSVFVGYTLFSLSIFDNPPRTPALPDPADELPRAGRGRRGAGVDGAVGPRPATPGARRRRGRARRPGYRRRLGSRGFVTELRDQQLEWAFLERTVPRLPERATLLSAVEVGGRNLDAFPEFLLPRAQDVRARRRARAAADDGRLAPRRGPALLSGHVLLLRVRRRAAARSDDRPLPGRARALRRGAAVRRGPRDPGILAAALRRRRSRAVPHRLLPARGR